MVEKAILRDCLKSNLLSAEVAEKRREKQRKATAKAIVVHWIECFYSFLCFSLVFLCISALRRGFSNSFLEQRWQRSCKQLFRHLD